MVMVKHRISNTMLKSELDTLFCLDSQAHPNEL